MDTAAPMTRAFAPVTNPLGRHPSERRIALDGTWWFRLDPGDRGMAEHWFRAPELFLEPISVPGCWQGQGFGGDGEDEVWDFRLRARVWRATYAGTGWYARAFRVPPEWKGGTTWLLFGGAHPTAEVWVNGRPVGASHAPFLPFGFDITALVSGDSENHVVVRVHEQDRDLGFCFNFWGPWSGLYRGVDLVATGGAFLDNVRALPDLAARAVRVEAALGGESRGCSLEVSLFEAASGSPVASRTITTGPGIATLELPVPSPRPWSPDRPDLYRVEAVLSQEGRVLDAASDRTGFVSLAAEGKRILVNGDPYYLRGTGDFVSCPETGSPDVDRGRWRRKLATLRAYGYNYVRCQSYAYPPEYYDVADEVGLLVQGELGTLGAIGGHSAWHVYQWPQPMPGVREALRRQWNGVVARDANHPSANLYCMSNELGQSTEFPRVAWRCYHETKRIKPTAMVIWTDGGYAEGMPGDFVNDEAAVDAKTTKPVVQHEFRWWSSFPDVRIAGKYTGAQRHYAADLAARAAAAHGIAHVLPRAAETSQRLQFQEAKAKMERCRRDNPRLAGICHFNAMDTNPSPQGIVDEFYECKYADAPTWLQANGDTVVLSSLGFADRVLEEGGTLAVEFRVSDFAHPPMRSPRLAWTLEAGGAVLARGTTDYRHEPFVTCPAGSLSLNLPRVRAATHALLKVSLSEGDREVTNAWDLWLFPRAPSTLPGAAVYSPATHTWMARLAGVPTIAADTLPNRAGSGVVLSERLDGALLDYVWAGGRVLLAASEGLVRPFRPKFGFTEGQYFFTPPANYPPYEDGHDGTIVQDHPMLAGFPHEGFADWQFFNLVEKAPPLELEPLGLNGADPVIRVMHSFPVGRSLGYLVEAAVAGGPAGRRGGLVITALSLEPDRVEARHLLASLIAYASGPDFAPTLELGSEAIEALMEGTALP